MRTTLFRLVSQPCLFAGILLFLGLQQMAFAQSGAVVTGTLINEAGDFLPGATVEAVESGTNEVFIAVTNEKGVFTFSNLKVGSVYDFKASYVGYEAAVVKNFTVKQSTGNTVLIKLRPADKELDQVVIIGYGTQKREMVTGSVATIRAEDFNKGVVADPVTLITGKVAGLSVTRPSGSDPNASADFSLRGAVSVEASTGPLIVIDGVIGGDLRTIAPADIASIDILRDGSAAAIYGSRATGGVIIVTTKKGIAGETKISYNGYASTETIAGRYKMLDADQYRKFAGDNGLNIVDEGKNTDWFNELTRTPFNHGHNLSLSGGAGKTTYNASLNYQQYQGIDLVADRRFINATVKLNTKALNDKLDFSILLANSYDDKYFADYSAFGQSLNMNPTFPVYNDDGSFYENTTAGSGTQWNPVANTLYNTNNSKEKRLIGNAKLTYSITPDLKAAVSYALTKNDFLNGSYTDNRLLWMKTSGLNGAASRSQSNNTSNIVETTIEYNKKLNDHQFNFVGGYSYQNEFNEGFNASNYNFISNSYQYYALGAGQGLYTQGFINKDYLKMGSFGNERTLIAYFGRLLYNYQEKYLLNVSFRREGASVLGKNNKWAGFPGISAGWILSKEEFLANSNFVNNLKLRVGYGETGNQYGISPYQSLIRIGPFIEQWGQSMPYAFINGQWVLTYGPTINPNANLKWETKKEFDAGIDFVLFANGWLSGSIDYYNRRIQNLIGNYSAQVPAGIYPLTFANAGSLSNEGVELSLNARVINRKNFTWNAGFVGAYNENKITSFSSDIFQGSANPVTQINGWGTEVQLMAPGQPVSTFYGKVFAGFTDDGEWLFLNKEGKPVQSYEIGDGDYTYLGNSIPKVNLGLTNSFVYRNFDLSLLIRSALGFKVLNAKRIFHENRNLFGTTNLFAASLHETVGGEPTFSSYYLEKGDYVKLDNVSLGYSFPLKGKIRKIRVSAVATNLLLITGFSGIDPELGVSPFNAPGVEMNSYYYPRTRSLTFGIQADF